MKKNLVKEKYVAFNDDDHIPDWSKPQNPIGDCIEDPFLGLQDHK